MTKALNVFNNTKVLKSKIKMLLSSSIVTLCLLHALHLYYGILWSHQLLLLNVIALHFSLHFCYFSLWLAMSNIIRPLALSNSHAHPIRGSVSFSLISFFNILQSQRNEGMIYLTLPVLSKAWHQTSWDEAIHLPVIRERCRLLLSSWPLYFNLLYF